jgi:IS1 family transposase
MRAACAPWGSSRDKTNGPTRQGKQTHQWQACARQCVATAEARLLADAPRPRRAHRWRERLALRGLCRAVGVRLTGLWPCRVGRGAACPDACQVRVPPRPTAVVRRRLEADAEALGSVVPTRAHQPWLGSAMDATPRPVRACPVGERRRARAQARWAKLPRVYQEPATCHTAPDDAATGVMPAERPQAMTQQARHTHPIERVTTTLRPRVSRLGREPRSCSTTLAPHIGASQYFMGYDHLTRATAAALPG